MTEKFDFDALIDRLHSDSYKWTDENNCGAIPMWVADMDFPTAPVVLEAIQERARHGAFGYVKVPQSYFDAMHEWYEKRHGWSIDRDKLVLTIGVVPAVSAVIKALVPAGQPVIVQTPAYNCFFSCILNNGCKVLENPLKMVDGHWKMDLEDLRRKAKESKFMILCNPHNPVGRAWTQEELTQLAQVCRQEGVTVLSDEIHGEFVFGSHVLTPFATIDASLRPRTVVTSSASKAFNIASLQNAFIWCEDEQTRKLVDRAVNVNEICDLNPFGVAAQTAAWSKGGPWMDALVKYLEENDRTLREIFAEELGEFSKDFPMTELEATYLEWVDCNLLNLTSDEIEHELKTVEGVRINAGSHYRELGTYIRINIACPRSRLIEGGRRIARGLRRLIERQS